MRTASVLFVASLLALPVLQAQSFDPPPYARIQSYSFLTGTLRNQTPQTLTVHRHIVYEPGAPSIRVFFEEVDVGPGSALIATSLLDGNQHVLTAEEVTKWDSSTAFFNGDAVMLELTLAPGARGSYEIEHLLVGQPALTTKTICGSDDRVPAFDNRSVRMLNSSGTGACSGWLTSIDDCVFSAGHCFPTYSSVAEVNVPPSLSSGALVHPPTQDQFPVDPASLVYNYSGLGNDWAIAHLNTNSLGQSASALYGYYGLGLFYPNPGDVIRINGYGSDSGTTNQTHQTNSGPYASTSGTTLRYVVDTTGGNSGSVVLDEVSGLAVAIHTNGGCSSSGGSNSGTSVNNAGLQAAFLANCQLGPPAQPVASFSSDATSVTVTQSINFKDTSTGYPSSWAWDFDEDGVTDSVDRDPTYGYAQSGTYDVKLTVSNSVGTDTIIVQDYVTVNPVNVVTPPYLQDFTHGLPTDGSWLFQSSNSYGDIRAGSYTGSSPASGGDGLLMASSSGGNYVTNEAILFFRLDPAGNATLRYYFKEFSDEDDAADGVFLSDGTSEVLLKSHQGGPSNWTLYTVDVGAAVIAAGMSPTATFRLIFRQYDNYEIPTDGHAIDDVTLDGLPSSCPAPTTYGTGEMGSPGTVASIGTAGGLPTAGNTSFAITLTGANQNSFCVLFSGDAQGSNPQSWGTILVAAPNFLRTDAMTDFSGNASVLIPITAGLVGTTRYFQYAVRDPGFGGNVQGSDGLIVTFCP